MDLARSQEVGRMTAGPTSMQPLARVVAEVLRRHRHELSGVPLLVAVSGGADSMALLLGLIAVPEEERPPLLVLHFSHGLRPRAEKRDAALVELVAAWWNLPVVRGHADVAQLAREAGRSVEEEARHSRYAFMARTARWQGAHAVALGHTQDDQAETVLLRLVRGTGLRGLGAMREWTPWADPSTGATVALFRPLLQLTRQDTEAVCAQAGVTPARDASNRSLAFARNRVRLRVLPEMERLNPNVRGALARLAAAAQEDERLLDSLAHSAVQGQVQEDGAAVTWPRSTLAALPRPLLNRVYQSAWEAMCGPGFALYHAHLEAMAGLLVGPSGRKLALPHGMFFSVTYSECRLGPTPVIEPLPLQEVPLQVPGVSQVGPLLLEVQEGVGLEAVGRAQDTVKGPWQTVLDADVVGRLLSIRRRRPGDRFHPAGMPGPKRLQDYLVDARVPRWERDAVPLLVASAGIAWVVGHRAADWAVATPATRRVLVVCLSRRLGQQAPS
jgi:tRNA(Ile)-lysidine synthase